MATIKAGTYTFDNALSPAGLYTKNTWLEANIPFSTTLYLDYGQGEINSEVVCSALKFYVGDVGDTGDFLNVHYIVESTNPDISDLISDPDQWVYNGESGGQGWAKISTSLQTITVTKDTVVDGLFYDEFIEHTRQQGLEFELHGDGDRYRVTGYTGTATEVVIPRTYNGLPVEEIAYGAFKYCTSLTSVTLPNSVYSIEYAAFLGCRSLESIHIPDNVQYIDGWAFAGCESLKSIYIPKQVKIIGARCFHRCDSLTDVYCEAEERPENWSSLMFGNTSAAEKPTLHFGQTGY